MIESKMTSKTKVIKRIFAPPPIHMVGGDVRRQPWQIHFVETAETEESENDLLMTN